MPKDAYTIYKSVEELEFLVGGRIDKVNMPSSDTLILLFHTKTHGNRRLLLSCNPSLPRLHLTTLKYENPETATGTLMYYRKRLVGACLTGIEKYKTERMATLCFSALDELKERVSYKLYVELTGKCANIIFVEQDGNIGNALRRVSAEVEGKRAVFAGLTYSMPNPTGRVGIFDEEAFISRVMQAKGFTALEAIDGCAAGLAKSTVTELILRAGIKPDAPLTRELCQTFISAGKALYEQSPSPVVTFDGQGKPIDFFATRYLECGGESAKSFSTLNEAMDEYYSRLFSSADFTAYAKPLKNAVKSAVNKNKKRLEQAAIKLDEAQNCDRDRLYGELITANIYRIKRGDKSVVCENYYADNAPVTIALDPLKNPQQNAAAYYKTYTKKKKAAVYAAEAKQAAIYALDELDGICAELDLCTTRTELDEVRRELVALGLMRPEKKRLKTKPVPSAPYTFFINGIELAVGKNGAQNERISRAAAKTDIWLHVKDAHGCHAVLKCADPDDETLVKAAEIAAYYSSAKGADKVAVDYAKIKSVSVKSGGRAEYSDYKTLFVSPKKPTVS